MTVPGPGLTPAGVAGGGVADLEETTYVWRGVFENAEVNDLHAEAFGHRVLDDDWVTQATHSLPSRSGTCSAQQ